MNETEQIARARQGDDQAWVTLVEAHQQAVFRLAYLLCGDQDTAEDIAQEVFLRAFQHLGRFDETRPLRPWLLKITRNQTYNRQRSLRRYMNALLRLREAWTVAREERSGLDRSEAEMLWQVVRTLKRADQEVIYLRCFLGLSVAETSEALEIAEGTVKSRYARALGRLKELVLDQLPELAALYSR